MSAHPHRHDHDHTHDRKHAHSPASSERRLLLAFALTAVTLIVEAFGGWWSGSLALIADAGHMLVDALALLLAWAGAHFARRPADAKRSFGYARLEVLAGFSNALVQFVLVAWIVVEATTRLMSPTPILSGTMLIVAVIGLLVNGLVLRVLHVHAHEHEDLNLRGANLHVLGDLLGSIGAVTAALLIRWMGWLAADPILSIVVSLLILRSAWQLLRHSAHILLEGAPEGVTAQALASELASEAELLDVHHIHLWQLSGGRRMATLHARVVAGSDSAVALLAIKRVLRERFRISHSTVQIEFEDCVEADCEEGNGAGH